MASKASMDDGLGAKDATGNRSIHLVLMVLVGATVWLVAYACSAAMGRHVFKLFLLPTLLLAGLIGWRLAVVNAAVVYASSMLLALHIWGPPQVWDKGDLGAGFIINMVLALTLGVIGDMYRKIQRLNATLRELTLVDPLTSLRNRRYVTEFVVSMAQEFLVKKTSPGPRMRSPNLQEKVFGILLVDIDHFKTINDTYGHAAGDRVLVELSRIYHGLVRFDDVVTRWGGEEFLVVLRDTDPAFLPVFAERIRQVTEKATIHLSDTVQGHITVSVGCVTFPFHPETPGEIDFDQCIDLADAALYKAKLNGRNAAVQIQTGSESSTYARLLEQLGGKANAELVCNDLLQTVRIK